jgi:hypothetical protein
MRSRQTAPRGLHYRSWTRSRPPPSLRQHALPLRLLTGSRTPAANLPTSAPSQRGSNFGDPMAATFPFSPSRRLKRRGYLAGFKLQPVRHKKKPRAGIGGASGSGHARSQRAWPAARYQSGPPKQPPPATSRASFISTETVETMRVYRRIFPCFRSLISKIVEETKNSFVRLIAIFLSPSE